MDQQLVAAVQILGPTTSTYRWNDTKERSEEWLCVLKSSQDLYEELERLIAGMHSYEVPGIVALPIGAGSASYVAWYEGMLKPQVSVKEQLLCAFGEAHARLITAAETAAARGVARSGDFGPREVLAHIVGWEAEAAERIPLLVGGAPALTYDDHAFNAAVVTVLGDQSFEVCVTCCAKRTNALLNCFQHWKTPSLFLEIASMSVSKPRSAIAMNTLIGWMSADEMPLVSEASG